MNDENRLAGQGYNILLSLLEKYGRLVDMAIEKHNPLVRPSRKLSDILHDIEDFPLYAITESARERALNTLQVDGEYKIPTIPEMGCLLSRPNSCYLLCRAPEVTGPMHELRKMELYNEGEDLAQELPFLFIGGGLTELQDQTGNRRRGRILEIGLVFMSEDMKDKGTGKLHCSMVLSVTIPVVEGQRQSIEIFSAMPTGARLDVFMEDGERLVRHPQFTHIPHEALIEGAKRVGIDLTMNLKYLYFIDLPRHYIIEETPKNADGRLRRKKAARYDDRERWIIMDPEEVKRKYLERNDLGGHHRPPLPHLRDGHPRTFKHERYRFMRGTTIQIRPTWIGEREWNTKQCRYRVVSRIGSTDTQA